MTGARIAMRSRQPHLRHARQHVGARRQCRRSLRDGRKLVDGGLVDNLPVEEVRQRCDADVVIAVNVGSPLLVDKQVAGVFSVVAQR